MSFGASRSYKIRQYSGTARNGTKYKNYSLTVPNDIAEHLPDGLTFVATMTEEGLLYQPQSLVDHQIQLPSWATVQETVTKKAVSKKTTSTKSSEEPQPEEQTQEEE